MFFPSVSTGRV